MVSFHQIGANTKKMCAKKSLNKKNSLKFLIKLKPRTSKPSKKFLFCNDMLPFWPVAFEGAQINLPVDLLV